MFNVSHLADRNITDEFPIGSYDDISYPANNFHNPVILNHNLSFTYDELLQRGATPIPKETGNGRVLTCRVMYQDNYWVRTNGNVFFKETYIRNRFTNSISEFVAPPFNIGFNYTIPSNYLHNPGIISKLEDLKDNIHNESKVDGFVATLCPHFFGINRGYGYNPQSIDREHAIEQRGKIDYMVDFNNKPVLIVENKTSSRSASS